MNIFHAIDTESVNIFAPALIDAFCSVWNVIHVGVFGYVFCSQALELSSYSNESHLNHIFFFPPETEYSKRLQDYFTIFA